MTRNIQQMTEHPPPKPASLIARVDTDIQQMAFASGDRHDPMAHETPLILEHPAAVTDAQAIAEYPLGPGKLIGLPFDLHDKRQVLAGHRPKPDLRRRVTRGLGW